MEREREREIFRERSRSPICKHTCIAIDEPVRELGGRVGGVRSRVTSRSVAVFAYLLRIACCVTFLTSERERAKSLAGGYLAPVRCGAAPRSLSGARR